jgi:hypothetical protein
MNKKNKTEEKAQELLEGNGFTVIHTSDGAMKATCDTLIIRAYREDDSYEVHYGYNQKLEGILYFTASALLGFCETNINDLKPLENKQYKVIQGFDHHNSKPLWQVVGIDNEFIGEWHTHLPSASHELSRTIRS